MFLRDMGDRIAELYRLVDFSSTILDIHGRVIHAIPYRAGSRGRLGASAISGEVGEVLSERCCGLSLLI
jgi:hypothetical protein